MSDVHGLAVTCHRRCHHILQGCQRYTEFQLRQQYLLTLLGLSGSSVSIDIFETFGDTINSFDSRQEKIVESLWNSQIDRQSLDNGDCTYDMLDKSRFQLTYSQCSM